MGRFGVANKSAGAVSRTWDRIERRLVREREAVGAQRHARRMMTTPPGALTIFLFNRIVLEHP